MLVIVSGSGSSADMPPPNRIRLVWEGSALSNYKILATDNLPGPSDFTNWQTIVQDIPGADGPVARTLDISGGPQYAFLRVAPMP